MTRQPSWLPSTSGWTQTTLNSPTMTAEAYSNFMVRYKYFTIQISVQKGDLYFFTGFKFHDEVFQAKRPED